MDNTISLLSNISKRLEIISQHLVSSNKPEAQSEAVQKDIINNKTTGLNSANNSGQASIKQIQPSVINNIIKVEADKAKKQEKSPIDTNISIKDIINFLGTLPASVQAVTKLHGTTLKRFENVLNKLSSSIVNFADKLEKTKMTDTSAKKYKMIIDSISTLSSSVKKISLMAPLIPIFDLSLLMLMPGIKLLTKVFDTFSNIKDSKAALNGIKAMNDLMKGMGIIVASSIAMAIAIKVLGIGEILKGIGLVLGIVTALSVLALVIAGVAAHIKLADIGLRSITRFITSMLAITAATMVLGAVIGLGMPLLVGGLAGVLAVMTAYSAITLVVAFVGTLIGGIEKVGILNQIVKFVAWNLAITTATLILGVFIAQGWEYLAYGFTGVLAILAGFTSISIAMAALAIKLQVDEKMGVLFQITKFTAACLALAFGTVLLGVFLKGHELETIEAFVLTSGVIYGIKILAEEVSTLTRSKTMSNASIAIFELGKFVALCEGLALGVIVLGKFLKGNELTTAEAFILLNGIVWASYGLATAIDKTIGGRGRSLENAANAMLKLGAFMSICGIVAGEIILIGEGIKNVGSDKVWEAFGLFTIIIAEGAGLAMLIESVSKPANFDKAVNSFLKIGAFLGIAGAVAGEIVLIANGIKEVGSNKIWEAFGLFTAIVVESAALAILANKFKSQTIQGAAAFIPIGLMLAGAGFALLGVVEILKIKQANNIEWLDVLAALGMMGLIVVEFGALALAASSVMGTVLISLPALGAIGLLAAGSLLVLGGVVALTSYALNNIGDDWGTQSLKTLGLMGLVIAEFGVLALAAFAATVPILLGTPALAIVEGFAFASVGLLNRIVDLQVKMNENNLTTDSINLTIGTIKSAIQGFVDLIKGVSFGGFFGTLKVMAKGAALSTLMNQVAVMVSALGSIALIATPDGKIRPAKFTDDKLIAGEPVDIIASGNIIISAIKQFTSLITKEFKDISLKDMVHAMFAMKAIGVMLDPISNFTNALMSFDSSDGTTLHTVKITDDGKVITGPDVHLPDVANLIAKAISTFAGTLFSKENAEIWDNMTQGAGWFRKSNAQKAMGILATVIEPVCTFVDTLSKFTGNGDGKTLTIIEFDENGKEKYRKNIDVIAVSTTIANAITNFARELSSHGEIWDEMMSGRYWPWGKGKVEKAMGVFSIVIEPVSKFVELLTKFSISPSGQMKVLDSKGVEHETNIILLAKRIADAVTNFAETISNIDPAKLNTSETLGNVLKSTVNPVNDFVILLSKYAGSPEGTLPILNENGEIAGSVDIIATSNNILNCSKAFKESILEIQTAVSGPDSDIINGAAGISKSVKNLFTSVENKKGQENLKKFGEILKTDTRNLRDFDNVLSKGSKNRVRSINELTRAIEELGNKVESEAITKLSNLFTALSNVNSKTVTEVVNEINKMSIGGGSGGGRGTSKDTIIKAIQEALAELDLDFNVSSIELKEKTSGGNKGYTLEGTLDGTFSGLNI